MKRSTVKTLFAANIFFAVIILAVALFIIAMTVYGLYLAFSASILLGIAALILEPSPAVLGLVMFFWEKDLAQMLIKWLESP